MKTLLVNIKQLLQVEENDPRRLLKGNEMQQLPMIENAFLLIEEGKIADFGEMSKRSMDAETIINAEGRLVLPCWCDSHTHLIFAKTREEEFEMRIKGATYEEIAAAGGGILNSAKKLNETPEEMLLQSALERLQEIKNYGTGAVEIKSGYGLTVEGELKMLRVAKKLKAQSDLTIKTTFLGAHAIPALLAGRPDEYKTKREQYIDLIINEMLPAVADENLADYIDVFCETNYFTPEETDKILKAGAKFGLKPKVHVNQFTSIGGIETCIKNNALSVDHLEVMTDEDIELLKNSNTIPTLLPSCSFFLSIPYAPARKLIDNGLPVALATDFNPGSTPSGNMNFVISLACIKMKMTPEEAINAATINGAAAMELSQTHGSIARGKQANVIITKEIDSAARIPYSFGSNLVEKVILKGKVQENR